MKCISIVISYYNSENTFFEFLERLNRVTAKITSCDFEYVIVDDGSNTFELNAFQELISATASSIRIVQLNKNYGQIIAVLTGLNYCTGDMAIIMSSDLQDPPELIEEIVLTQERTNCEVIGCGRASRNDSWVRNMGSYLWYRLVVKKINTAYPKKGSDYALISRRIIDQLIKNDSTIRFLQNEILTLSQSTVFIEYQREGKKNRKSEWNFWKMGQLIFDIVYIHFNFRRIIGFINLLMLTIFGLLYLATCQLGFLWLMFGTCVFINSLFFILQRSVKSRLSFKLKPNEISQVIYQK